MQAEARTTTNDASAMTDPIDDILLTAYALGEVDDPADLARVRRWVATDASAARAVDELRLTATVLAEGLKGEPEVGLTAIQYAGIERRLAADAAADAPGRAAAGGSIPLRPNRVLWGSLAASTLIVATMVAASVLPQLWRDPAPGNGGTGGHKAGKGAAGDAHEGESEAVMGSGAGGLAAAPGRTPPSSSLLTVARPPDGSAAGGSATGAADADGAPAGDPTDWPLLRTSAGGLPWPAVAAADTGLREPAFVVAGDFPVALVPPTPAYPDAAAAGRGPLSALRWALAGGRFPAPHTVRSDELVNAVRYEDAPPADDLVTTTVERAVCPWDTGHLLVRVVVRSTGRARAAAAPTTADAGAAAPADSVATGPAVAPLVRDLRLSVEVNPAAVAGYRVLGYESAPRSWGEWPGRDDHQVFAAGKTFTTLLEVVPVGQPLPAPGGPAAPLRYRKAEAPIVTSTDLLTVAVDFRQGPMATPEHREVQIDTVSASAIELESPDFRTAAAAAALGASLRQADPASAPTLEVAVKLLSDVTATAPTEDRQSLLDVAKAVQAMRRP